MNDKADENTRTFTVEELEGVKVDHGAEGHLAPYEIGLAEGHNALLDKLIGGE